ncbi:ABC-type transport auxiliary lipoprotein family protein [Mariluticola halotolerans]|uniref:ABC-type transport auxiliary lipoprotein family protein n=1 Tax=Mariluticola halotolerans TaxID=2909283 RepID=UPI0026E461D3|nr:ABC-type transport auxiliary lipoprotein family protein [Mariluticola halotolerans]UJQ94661.1 ABC-type transport auxiliary lipoprotein family protein [Mariluticola halotolerans]
MNRRKVMFSGAAMLALPLMGCSVTGSPPVTFDLSAATAEKVRRRSTRTIVITTPKAVQTYDTMRVVVREPGGILSYLPDAQLSDTLPSLLRTRVLQSFENAAFPNIGLPDDQLSVDVTLALEIRAFEIDVSEGSVASVSLAAKLVNERQGSIYASSVFSAETPAPITPGTAAIAGLNEALQQVTREIVAWTAAKA